MTTAEGAAYLHARGLAAMPPELAIRALAQAIDHGEDQLTIADVDWPRFTAPFTLRRPAPLLSAIPGTQPPAPVQNGTPAATADGTLAGKLAGLTLIGQDQILLDLVRAEAAAILGHPSRTRVEPGRAFSDLGFDSLTAVELRNRLSHATGLPLPATLLFDYPVPLAAARFLRAELAGDGVKRPRCRRRRPWRRRPMSQSRSWGWGAGSHGGVAGPEDLWDLVEAGTDAIGGFPGDRGWDVEGLYDPDPERAGVDVCAGVGGSWRGRVILMRSFSGSARGRRWRWIRSSGCCWKSRGRRWSGRELTLGRCEAARRGCSLGRRRRDGAGGCRRR